MQLLGSQNDMATIRLRPEKIQLETLDKEGLKAQQERTRQPDSTANEFSLFLSNTIEIKTKEIK